MGKENSAAALKDPKIRLEILKNKKARLGRVVEEARKLEGHSADPWLLELQEVSREVKRLQKLIKQQLNVSQPQKKWAPPKIVPPPAITNMAPEKPITIIPCAENMSAAADAYVGEHPGASIWHRPAVSSFIGQTYGHKTRYLCAVTESGELAGVLPLVQLKSRLFGNFLVSMPFFNYGAVLADNTHVAHRLINAADQWREQQGAQHLALRFLQDNQLGLCQRTKKVTFWLPLPDQCEDLWNSFQPKLRAQIRKGERELSDISIGGSELLDEFYRVFSVNMRDLGTPVYGYTFFHNLLESLKGQAWLVVVRINGRAAGCAFLTGYRDRMEIPWASTLRKQSHTGINMIMYWKILEFAIQKRFKIFDFGRCTENAGTYKFKRQWGAQAIRLYWSYSLSAGKELRELSPQNPKFKLLIAVWKLMPVWFTQIIGPPIVKYLP